MSNQQGSAVVIVLLFLGVVSMIGAGLILQSQMDVQFTSALQGTDMTMSMGDAGSVTAFRNIPEQFPMAASYQNPIVVSSGTGTDASRGTYTYRTIFMGPAPQIAGAGQGELGQGGYEGGAKPYYWTCEGNGRTTGMTENQSRVQVASIKLHPDN